MGFQTAYSVGGELDKLKKVDYIKQIKNFAQLSQPYNKMLVYNIPAIKGSYNFEYTTLDEVLELLSLVVTCSGYGEDDYYNIYVNDELWFDTWFPTEVKEGLYIGTSTYVCELPLSSKIRLEFFNISGTSKKIWFGLRFLKERSTTTQANGQVIDTDAVATPTTVIP